MTTKLGLKFFHSGSTGLNSSILITIASLIWGWALVRYARDSDSDRRAWFDSKRSTGKPGNDAFYLSCSLNFSLLHIPVFAGDFNLLSFNDSITIFCCLFMTQKCCAWNMLKKVELRFRHSCQWRWQAVAGKAVRVSSPNWSIIRVFIEVRSFSTKTLKRNRMA